MDEVLRALTDQHAQLDGLLVATGDDGWRRPTRCEGWTVSDVVLHLAQTDELALASVEERFEQHLAEVARAFAPAADVDAGAAALVDAERGQAPAELHDRWRTGAAALRRAFGAADSHARVRWVAGRISVHTLATTRLAETWIHTGDVGDALGVDLLPTRALQHIARLAWRTLPYAFERAGRRLDGAVAFELRAPDGDTWTFTPAEGSATTTIRGDALDLCLVAARRVDPRDTTLTGEGRDADAVLELVRTYA